MKKSSDVSVSPPLPLETLEQYVQEIFIPIKRGENVTTIWVPMAGRRIRNKFIITYPQLFKKIIGDVNKYLLVYVEPLELTEESAGGYLKLVARSIVDEYCKKTNGTLSKENSYYYSGESYSQILESLDQLIKEITIKGFEIVLFLGEFDEFTFSSSVFYNNIKALWVHADKKLHFVFLLHTDVTTSDLIKELGELNEVILRNIVYVPLAKGKEIDYLIDLFAQEYNERLTKEEKDLLVTLCGGHPYLLKSCYRLIAIADRNRDVEGLKTMLLSHVEPTSAAKKIFDLLTKTEKDVLIQISREKIVDLPPTALNLVKLGLIEKINDEYWVPFSLLFQSVIEDGGISVTPEVKSSSKGLYLDAQNGRILLGENNIEDKFTRQEYEIMRYFLTDPEKLRSRDDIGGAIWGKLAYEKYSDWAIDQVMSKIRKKLSLLGAEKSLVTVRGRGYKLNII